MEQLPERGPVLSVETQISQPYPNGRTGEAVRGCKVMQFVSVTQGTEGEREALKAERSRGGSTTALQIQLKGVREQESISRWRPSGLSEKAVQVSEEAGKLNFSTINGKSG